MAVLNDYGKLILLLTAMVGGFAMAIVGIVAGDSSALATGAGLVGTVVGYLTGNGVLARTGQAPSPVVVPAPARIAERMAADMAAELAAEAERLEREGGTP